MCSFKMEESGALVLEILRQDSLLAMSVFEEKELSQTLRHYSQLPVSFTEINKLCLEVISILNKVGRKGTYICDYIDSLKKTGQMLWDHLLTRSVKDRLKTTIIKNLVLTIDEELIHIPWELLYDGNDFLCLKFNLGRLVRTKEQLSPMQYRSLTSTPKMLILANPTEDLKSAYLEGVYIKNQFDRKRNEIGIDFKSTRIDTLYVKKNLRDYDIVHFAGHCEYDRDNPENTGWVLSDGRFTTTDILALGESLPFPSLIFSNACQSAKSITEIMSPDYQEKNYSLASAFLFSGVRHYIGTIWKVEDPVGVVFAKEFYTQLIKGASIGECMRLSRLRLIKEYGITAISWASYLLYGNPNFILFRRKVRPAALKFKRDFSRYKKQMARLTLAAFIIFIIIFLYLWLPTRNPTTYFLFLRSKKLFLKGNNQEVSLLCEQIIKKDPGFLAVYPLLADSYHKLGKRDLALKYYFEYARFSEKRKENKHLVSAYLGIGWIYQLKGDYPKAFDFYNKAIALSRENKDTLNEATGLRRLAEWYTDKKEYNKALELLTRSSEINRQRQHIYGHRYNLACDYFDIGLVFINKDDYVTAREFYKKSRILFEKFKLDSELSDCYFNIGETYFYEKQYQKALDSYLQGLNIDRIHNNKFNMASDYNMLGELYVEMDNLDEAEKFFTQSITIAKQIDAPLELASAYHNLGLLYKEKGQKNKAREYLRLAQEIYSRIDTLDYQEVKQALLELESN